MSEPLETSELLAFTRTVDARSLSRAAAELGVPRATVSRRLARLEERLGVRLLRRTTRSLALTDAGSALYRHARIALEAVEQAESSVRRDGDAIRGELRVSAPPIVSDSFRELVSAFMLRYPDVRVQLELTSRLIDLARDGYDVALRATTVLEPGLIARVLAKAPMIVVAAPSYLSAHGTPRTARDLRRHRCLVGFARGELPQSHWPLARGGRVQVESVFATNDLGQIAHAAVRGLGLALLPRMAVTEQLARGDLVPVLTGVIGAETRIAVVHLEREFVPPQVRAFVDAVVAWAPGQFDVPMSMARRKR